MIFDGFVSKKLGRRLQREEIHLIADLILIYYAVNRSFPTRAQLLALWEEYTD